MRETGIIATRQLAKRQLTWLRSMPERIVIDCMSADPAGQMLAQIQARSEALIAAEVQPIAGVRQALEQIPLPLAVASNSRRHNVIASVERAGLTERAAGRIFSADMVERPKPAPDVYLLAARTAGVVPERCLVIEDSPTGATAALAAGMQVLGFTGASHIPQGHGDTLRRIGVLEVFDDMRDLPALFERLA